MPHDVFVSHASEDKLIADATVAKLESAGIRCWIAPRDILPGSDWSASILDALDGARVVVLIFSKHSNTSTHVATEVERAVSGGLTIIPMRIDQVVPARSLEFFLTRPHWLDAYSPPLERHLDYLVEVVQHILAGPGVPREIPRPGYPVRESKSSRLLVGVVGFVVMAAVIGWAGYTWYTSPPHASLNPEPVNPSSATPSVEIVKVDPVTRPLPPATQITIASNITPAPSDPNPSSNRGDPEPPPTLTPAATEPTVPPRPVVPDPPPRETQPISSPPPVTPAPPPAVRQTVTVTAADATFELQCFRTDPASNVVFIRITLVGGAESASLDLRNASIRNAASSRELSIDGSRQLRPIQARQPMQIRVEDDPSSNLPALRIDIPVLAGGRRGTIDLARQLISG